MLSYLHYRITENKKEKSNFIATSMKNLMESIGGTKAMEMKKPTCGGHYNTTESAQVSITTNAVLEYGESCLMERL